MLRVSAKRISPRALVPNGNHREAPSGRLSRRAGSLAIVAWLVTFTLPLVAQTTGSVGIGASIVEYDGFLAAGAAVIAPALRFDSPAFSLGGQASWTRFETGSNIFQGTAGAAWLTPSWGAWRLELSGSAGAAQYRGEQASGHLLGGARLHVRSSTAGGWISAAAGRSYGAAGTPLELAAAGWTVKNRLTWLGTVTATTQSAVRYLDVLGTIRWTGPGVELEAQLGARPWGRSPSSEDEPLTGAYGELTALVSLNRWLSLSLGGGKYRSDPVRRTLGAEYLSAGVRLGTLGRSARHAPINTTSASGDRVVPREEGSPRLEIRGRGEGKTIRIRAPGAKSVELMGDFTDWLPVPLVHAGSDMWETELSLPPGVYRVNIRLDGGAWRVPGGARVERTEFGGAVGIVVVP